MQSSYHLMLDDWFGWITRFNNLFLSDEFGAEGFSGPSHDGSFRSDPPSHDLSPGPGPGIGFAPGPGSVPTGPPGTNYNNIQIPPGAHAPANTPAELQPSSGMTQNLNFQTRLAPRSDPKHFPLCGLLETAASPVQRGFSSTNKSYSRKRPSQ